MPFDSGCRLAQTSIYLFLRTAENGQLRRIFPFLYFEHAAAGRIARSRKGKPSHLGR